MSLGWNTQESADFTFQITHFYLLVFLNHSQHRITLVALCLCAMAGKEWLNSLTIRCRDKHQKILQGRFRFSMRPMLATLLARLQCLCIWMLALASIHPWYASIGVVCVSRLIAAGPPSIVYRRNGIVSYRNYLRHKYHIYPNGCVDRW